MTQKNEQSLAEQFEFLDELREGGSVNMFGAGPWLRAKFGIDRAKSYEVLALWQKTFDPDKSPAERAKAGSTP